MKYNRLSEIKATPPFAIDQVLWTSPNKPRSICDLKKDLPEIGAIKVGPGRYAYKGSYAEAIEWARQTAIDIGRQLKFEQWYLPKLVPSDVLNNFGCIEVWPAYLLKVSPYTETNYTDKNTISMQGKTYFLDPVQCAAFYETLANLKLDDVCPLKILDISGYTYRNEFIENLSGTIKTIEFLRAEYVFVGKDFVKNARAQLIESYIDLFEKFQLTWRLTVGKGCYDMPTQADKDEYMAAKDISSVPVLDIEIFSSSLNSWIEVIGASYLQGRKLARFGYAERGYESGCIGVGLTRLAGLLLENLGVNVTNWNCILKMV
jgi:seryl-tRNA synthetase